MYICYHHANRTDRHAVISCDNCRKGLCAECADKFKSRATGRVLCVDCYNAELVQIEAKATALSKKNKKQYITKLIIAIVLGAIPVLFGILATVAGIGSKLIYPNDPIENLIIGPAIIAIGIWGSTILASFSKLLRDAKKVPYAIEDFYYGKIYKEEGCLSSVSNYFSFWIFLPIWLLSFVVSYVGVFLLAPVLFVFEIIGLKKDSEYLKEVAEFQEYARAQNRIFFKKARAMTMNPTPAPSVEQINYVKGLLAKIDSLKGQIVEAGKDKARVAQLQSQINELNNQVENQNVEIEGLKGANDEMSKKFGDMAGTIELITAKLDRMGNKDKEPERRNRRGK